MMNRTYRIERDTLREALASVEFCIWDFMEGFLCPWCNESESNGHATDCKRQAALFGSVQIPKDEKNAATGQE